MAQYDVFVDLTGIPLAPLGFVGNVPTAQCPVIMVKGKRLHALAHFAAPLPGMSLRRVETTSLRNRVVGIGHRRRVVENLVH